MHPATRVVLGLAAAGAVVLASFVAFAVPAGQPYDEPSHWGTVMYFADHHRLPELGEPGVTYEAQNGPVYYMAAAVLERAVGSVADESVAFRAVRLMSAAFVAAVVFLTYRLAVVLAPGRPGVALASATFMGITPTVALFSGSVQNDTTAVVIALGAAVLAVGLLREPAAQGATVKVPILRWAVLGAVIGLAALTKVQTLALLPALVVGATCASHAHRRQRLLGTAVAVLTTAVVTGWWFVRNVAVYGDLTGRAGVDRTGAAVAPLSIGGVGDMTEWTRSMVSVVWVPTEYFRNAFHAPVGLQAAAFALTVAIALLVLRAVTSRWRPRAVDEGMPPPHSLSGITGGRPELSFAWAWAIITFATYAVITIRWAALSPRLLYVAAAPVVIGVAALVDRLLPPLAARAVAFGVLGSAAVVTVWMAFEASHIAPQTFWIALGA